MEYEVITNKSDEEIINTFVRPFDLSKAPLFRAKIVDRGDYQLLLFDIHHIAADGGTIGILTDELIKLYNGDILPELRVQYRDYSEWLAKKDIEKQRDYWLDKFNGEIPVLNIPTDYPREQTKSYSGGYIMRKSENWLPEKVAAAAKELETTEYTILLSAFMILLARYTEDDEDIIIGTPFAGRNHPDLENMAGMFVNTIALRGNPAEEKPIKTFIQEIGEEFLSAVENQDYPFEELLDALDIEKDSSRNPLFDVMFVLQNNENSYDKLNAAGIAEVESEHYVSRFDITLSVGATENGYMFAMEYCDKLFKQYFINGLLASYEKTVCEVIDNLDMCIEDIDTMSLEEQEQILKQFNDAEE